MELPDMERGRQFVRAFILQDVPGMTTDKYALVRAQKKALMRELRSFLKATGPEGKKDPLVPDTIKSLRYLSKKIRDERRKDRAYEARRAARRKR